MARNRDQATEQETSVKGLAAAIAVAVVLAVISLFIGVSDVSLSTLFGTEATDCAAEVMLVSRIPRTLQSFWRACPWPSQA